MNARLPAASSFRISSAFCLPKQDRNFSALPRSLVSINAFLVESSLQQKYSCIHPNIRFFLALFDIIRGSSATSSLKVDLNASGVVCSTFNEKLQSILLCVSYYYASHLQESIPFFLTWTLTCTWSFSYSLQ